MKIEIKKSIKPVNYIKAIKYLEKRLDKISKYNAKEFIWILEHPSIYTAGSGFDKNDILDVGFSNPNCVNSVSNPTVKILTKKIV